MEIDISDYSYAVNSGHDIAIQWVNDRKIHFDELGLDAYDHFILNIKTRYVELYTNDVKSIIDDVIKLVEQDVYRTYYSAIVYNILSKKDFLNTALSNETCKTFESFLIKHPNRFLLQYIIDKNKNSVYSDTEYDNISNIFKLVIPQMNRSEYHSLYLHLTAMTSYDTTPSTTVLIIEKMISDGIVFISSDMTIKYELYNRILLIEYNSIGDIVNEVNTKINELLFMRGDIKDTITRVITVNNDLLYCAFHASLTEKDVFQIVNQIFKDKRVTFKRVNHLFNKIENKNIIAQQFIIGAGAASGFTNDEEGIDDKVLNLVNSLSSIPGVKTFSSCDGHYKMAFYVLWTINDNNLFKLNKIAELLSESANEAYVLYKFPVNKTPVISLYFAHDKWNGSNHRNAKNLPHFEFRITMPLLSIDDKYPEMFYDFTNSISEIFAIKVKEVDWTLL